MKFYTTQQFANQYAVTVRTTLALIEAGELAAIDVSRRGGKPRWRISEAAIAAFEQRRTARPAAAKTKVARKPRAAKNEVKFY